MKLKWDKKYIFGGITAFCVIVFSIMFFVFLNNITVLTTFLGEVATILTPFTLAFVIAYLLNPIMKFIESQCIDKIYYKIKENNSNFGLKKYEKFRRGLAIVLSLILGFAIIISVFVMILPELYTSIAGIVLNLPGYISNLQNFLDNTFEHMPWLEEYITIDVNQISDQIMNIVSAFFSELQSIISNIIAGVMGVVTVIKNVFIAVVLSVYILSSKEMFGAQLRKLLYAIFPIKFGNSVIRTFKHSDKVFGGFIVGKLIDSLIIGILCFIGLTAITLLSPFEMPFILLISTIIGITNIIPFFGPFIGGVPCGVLIFLVDPMATLVFAIFILVLQQIDGNIIGPKILGDSTGLSAFWVMFAILLGGGLFGVVGMLLGVPTFSVCYSILTGFFVNILEKKGLSTKTADYYSKDELDESLESNYYMSYLQDDDVVDVTKDRDRDIDNDSEKVIVIEKTPQLPSEQPKCLEAKPKQSTPKKKSKKKK